jgi:hypothetical protein
LNWACTAAGAARSSPIEKTSNALFISGPSIPFLQRTVFSCKQISQNDHKYKYFRIARDSYITSTYHSHIISSMTLNEGQSKWIKRCASEVRQFCALSRVLAASASFSTPYGTQRRRCCPPDGSLTDSLIHCCVPLGLNPPFQGRLLLSFSANYKRNILTNIRKCASVECMRGNWPGKLKGGLSRQSGLRVAGSATKAEQGGRPLFWAFSPHNPPRGAVTPNYAQLHQITPNLTLQFLKLH